MKRLAWLLAAAVLTMIAVAPSFAEAVNPLAADPRPADPKSVKAYAWNDWQHRLSLGVTARYEFTYFKDAPAFTPGKEWTGGAVAAYEVTSHFTLVAGSLYGLDTKFVRTYVGGVIPLYGGE